VCQWVRDKAFKTAQLRCQDFYCFRQKPLI
jgi:hypothetical protein